MKNREYYENLSDEKLAKILCEEFSGNDNHSEVFCKNVCKYADKKGSCTKLDESGSVDCPWTKTQRIVNWLQAEKK